MFSSIIGNETAKDFLRRMIAGGRVPHGLLFAGPEGIGKREFALELARAMMCRSASDGEACGECPICRRIGVFELPTSEKGEDYDRVFLSDHPDVGMAIPFKRNLRVGAIRELEREANFRPYESELRVFIVNDADKMNDSSSNALLKTLEEPPSTTFLILVTSRPDSLLHTIRSRCQTIRFAPVAAGEIEKLLLETHKLSADDAAVAARVCGGSVGRALSLDIAQFRAMRELMMNVIRSAVVTGDLSAMLQTAEQLNDAKNKDRFEENIGILQTLIRDILATSKGAETSQIVNADIAGQISELAKDPNAAALSRWLIEIEELLASLNVNVNRKAATDKLFVSMSA